MTGVDASQAGVWGIIIAIAGMAGAFLKAAWSGLQDVLKLRHTSDEDKQNAKASIISLAQSQMNDVNTALWTQIKSMEKTISDQSDTIGDMREEMATVTKDNRELRRDLRVAQGTIVTLQDRVKELEK